jgi:hypothetical protein
MLTAIGLAVVVVALALGCWHLWRWFRGEP